MYIIPGGFPVFISINVLLALLHTANSLTLYTPKLGQNFYINGMTSLYCYSLQSLIFRCLKTLCIIQVTLSLETGPPINQFSASIHCAYIGIMVVFFTGYFMGSGSNYGRLLMTL